jgi:hypothetical protein
MIATTQAQAQSPAIETLRKGVGLPGRIAIGWTMGGGFLVGGFLVAAMTLMGQLSAMGLLVTASGLFLIGGLLGYIHGATLGFFGRPAGMTRRDALYALGLAGVYALPMLAIGLVASGWIAMTVVAQYAGRAAPWVMVGIAWFIGAVVVAYAATKGWQGLRNAYARWPQRRLGTALVAASFAALLVTFLAERPELWGVQMRVTETGAFLLAAFATLWIAGPMVTIALKLIDQLPLARAGQAAPSGMQTAASAATGLAVGVVLGLLALPFYGAPLMVAAPAAAAAGSLGAVAIAASQALITETLLRLFLVSAVAWILLRAYRVPASGAALAAVTVGAVAQLVLYMPAIIGIGFPSLLSAFGFVGLVVLLPALAFGALYWTRGFGTALLAHATAVAMIAFLA